MEQRDLLQAVERVAGVLERLGVAYHVGGSVASSVHGAARSSIDADLVADLEQRHVTPFYEALRGDFYVDDEMIRDAVRRRSSFHVIHFASLAKVDVFVPKNRPFDRASLGRRALDTLGEGPDAPSVYVATAEDMILVKLEWYEKGGRTSEQQWNDVLGMIRTQGPALDQPYLRRWAAEIGVTSLLDLAMKEASGNPR